MTFLILTWLTTPLPTQAALFDYELVYTRFTNRLVENIVAEEPLAAFATISVRADENNDGTIDASEEHVITEAGNVNNVLKVSYQWNDVTQILTQTVAPDPIAQTEGADGILFAPDGDLIVGGQTNILYKLPADGSALATPALIQQASLPSQSFHVALDQNQQRVWTSDQPDNVLTEVSVNFGTVIASHPISGDTVTQIAFAPTLTATDSNLAYYSNSASDGLGGSFGILDMTGGAGFTATPHLPSQDGAHSIQYDPFTGDIFLFGDHTIVQVDISGNMADGDGPSSPTNPVFEASLDLTLILDDVFGEVDVVAFGSDQGGEATNRMDQGVVTGDGQLFAAVNTGHLVFIDYASDGLINGKLPFLETDSGRIPFLDNELDDLAPVVGLGAPANPIPEPTSLALILVITTLTLAKRRTH